MNCKVNVLGYNIKARGKYFQCRSGKGVFCFFFTQISDCFNEINK